MEQADLITAGADGSVICLACQWRCALRSGDIGRCKVRVGVEGGIALPGYGLISGAAIRPIEDYRLWHFLPDTMVLAIGGWGYATIIDQGRGPYSTVPDDPARRRRLDPDRIATFALERLCRGVIWAYGEPAVNHEYLRALLQLSRAASRYTALVTTGVMTVEALDQLGPYLDGISLDLRGFSDASYARLGGLPDWRAILTVIERALHRWRVHIEVTTRIHHGVNDDPAELRALVAWIRDTLGVHTPWHVLPGDAGSETAASTMRARRIGHEGELHFIYGSEPNQPTRCPLCHATLVTRTNGVVRLVGLDGSRCINCGYDTKMQLSIYKHR